jgi:integrase
MTKRGNGEGSIFQRASDERWVGVITLTKPGQPRKRKSIVRRTRAEVVAALRELHRDLDNGIVPVGDRQTTGTYLAGWLDTVQDLRPRTRLRYRELLVGHVVSEIGAIPLAKLTPSDVRSLLQKLRTKPGRYGRTLSPQTVLHCRSVLRRALSDAVRDGAIMRNVASGKLVSPPKVERHEIPALTPEQADAIEAAVHEDQLGPLYATALWTGMRQGELLGLTWDAVDFEGRWIHVRQTYGRVAGTGGFDKPKTEKSRRHVPMIDETVAALRDQRKRQAAVRLLAGPDWQDLDLVFTDSLGRPLDPTQVSKRLHVLLAPIGLERLRFHDLRHGCATLLIRRGVSIVMVAKILGHSTPVTTMNVYAHVAEDSLQEAMGRMSGLRKTGS